MGRPAWLTRARHEGAAIAALVTERLDALAGGAAPAATSPALAPDSRLAVILAALEATDADRALCLTCLAPEFDPRLYARYQEATGRAWATEWLASSLFAEPGLPLLTEGSASLRWLLIERQAHAPGEPPALMADPALREWVGGMASIPARLDGAATGVAPLPPLDGWEVDGVARQARAALERGASVLLIVEGTPGGGRATAAAVVAEALGRRAFGVRPGTTGRDWTRRDTIIAHRFAHVAGTAIIWRGPPPAGALLPAGLPPAQVQAVTLDPGQSPPEVHDLVPLHLKLPALGAAERSGMLQAALPESGGWPEADRQALLRRRTLTPGTIARLARAAPRRVEEATALLDAGQEAAMGGLARKVSGAPGWDDIALPKDLEADLRTLAFEAALRVDATGAGKLAPLFARESGLVALFAGPPGAGKTMAAQVLARDLGLDLFRIDSGAVVSKYIGETSKNLGSIFARATHVDAVLFFDEADALFAKRTEVRDSRDRHANADTSYLLQLIEGGFDGVAILATNRKTDIDPAFQRRIRYVFDFPRPSAVARTRIWTRAAEALSPERAAALAPIWEPLGAALDVTGAQIKTTLVAAHFAALRSGSPMTAEDVVRAAERELAKEGRTLGARERERIRAHA